MSEEESMKRLAPALFVAFVLGSAGRILMAQTTGDPSTASSPSATAAAPTTAAQTADAASTTAESSTEGDPTPCDKTTTGDTSATRSPPTTRDTPIHHDIYITLKDHSKFAVQKQVKLGKEYLGVHKHPGELSFSATVLATGLKRHQQVPYLHNETDFDVAFHLVFANARAHNLYQCSYAHVHEFIPKSKSNWQELRVFDSVKR